MKKNKYVLVVALILLAFIINFVRYSKRAPGRHYSDFRVYYATGERFLNKENIYSRPDQSITPFKYSPTFAMLFSPLSLVSKKTASLIFFTINFFMLIAACFLSKRLIVEEELSYKQYWIFFFFPVLLSSRFIVLVWDSGQVNLIMFVLVLLSLYLMNRGKDIVGAGFLGLSILFKYMPVLFLPYLFFKRKYKIVIWALIFVLILSFLPMLVVGFDANMDYLKEWIPSIVQGDSFDKGSWVDNKNQSIYSMFLRNLTKISSLGPNWCDLTFNQGLGISLIFGSLIYLMVLIRKGNSSRIELIDYAVLLICMAIFNPNAWMLNFVVFLFAYMLLFYHLIKQNYKDRITIVLIFLSFILVNLLSETVVSSSLETFFEELSSVTIAAILLIVALFRLKFIDRGYYCEK